MGDGSNTATATAKAQVYGALFVIPLVYFATVPFATVPLAREETFIDLALDLMLAGALLNALRTVAQDRKIVAITVLFGAHHRGPGVRHPADDARRSDPVLGVLRERGGRIGLASADAERLTCAPC